MSAEDTTVDDSAAPLIEHLTELRSRLIKCVVAFLIGMIICFTVWNPIFNFLTQPLCSAIAETGKSDCGLILIKLQEGFFVAIRISIMGGFALAFPVISYQLWRFVAPGLYSKEKNAFLPFLVASPFMFILGSGFAFLVVIPLAFDFFLNFQQFGMGGEAADPTDGLGQAGITFQGSVAEYLSLTITFIMAFGMCFQLPVLLSLLGKAGLVSSKGLAHVRKYAVVAILVVAGLVTPPDIFTQVILFVVVFGLYEISIQIVKRIEIKREARMRADGTWYEDDEFDDDEDEHPEEKS